MNSTDLPSTPPVAGDSPFRLVKEPAAAASVEVPSLPGGRKGSRMKSDSMLRDVVERVKKAVKAPPLDLTPRPAKDERKTLAPAAAAEVAAPEPGLTVLPPRKPRKGDPVAEMKEPDPFETNEVAVQAIGFGEMIAATCGSATVDPATFGNAIPGDAALAESQLSPNPAAEQPLLPLPLASEEFPAAGNCRRVSELPVRRKVGQAPPEAPVDPFPKATAAQIAPPASRKKPAAAKKRPVASEEQTSSPAGALPMPKRPGTGSGKIEDWLMAAGFGVLQRTPRSEGPIEEVKPKADESPMLSRGRVRFCCPACQHTISMPRRVAGTRTRCPQCGSALRAPDPRRNRGAYNQERTIEALLHPERFELPDTSRRRILGVPIPEPQSLLIGGAAALLVGSITQFFIAEHRTGMISSTPLDSTAAPTEAPQEDPAVLQKAAEEVVRRFLEADGWERKVEYVRDAKRVGPMMQRYYSRMGGGHSAPPESVRASTPGYYSNDQLPQQTSVVAATFPDGASAKYRVEFLPGGPKVEWESSVAYSAKSWNEILRTSPAAPPELVRVAAHVSTYWNDDFNDSKVYLSVGLQDPITKEPLGNAYIPYQTEDGARLRTFLAGTSSRRTEDVTLEIKPVTRSSKTRQVEIVRFVKGGFRHLDAPVMASTQ